MINPQTNPILMIHRGLQSFQSSNQILQPHIVVIVLLNNYLDKMKKLRKNRKNLWTQGSINYMNNIK